MSILDEFFERILNRRTVFRDKKYLSIDYVPDDLPHREEEILRLANILASIIRGDRPSNVFEYGPVGTGKTVVTKLVIRKFHEKTSQLGIRFGFSYVNCRFYRTNYRALVKIARDTGLNISKTGLPPDIIITAIMNRLEEKFDLFTIILDEIDWLVKYSGDDIIYQFTRLNEELKRSKVSIVGITNDIKFREYLDARVLSSLSEEIVVFQPYNQEQLYDILLQRAKMAFFEGCISDEAIRYAAILAARDGDARRAIDLLRVAGEIADREGDIIVTAQHVQRANMEVEKNIIKEIIMTLPPNQQLLILSILYLHKIGDTKITTGKVKKVFDDFMSRIGRPTVTLRRLNDYIAELETLGIISTSVVSFGRYGRTRIIRLEVSAKPVEEYLRSEKIYDELLSERLVSTSLIRHRIDGPGGI